MRKLLVFQHVADEPLGTLDSKFRGAGLRIRYVNFERGGSLLDTSVTRYDGLVVLGGPMAADADSEYPHLAAERDAIREALQAGMPLLGICLGAQLMAAALGGRTLRDAAEEKGWVGVTPTDAGREDALIAHIGAGAPVFQWHSDTFTLPAEAVQLARSDACEQQAFRIGDNAYGLQFHLEADRALIERWLDRWQQADPGASGVIAAARARIEADNQRYIDAAARLGDALFGSFIDRFFGRARRIAQASR